MAMLSGATAVSGTLAGRLTESLPHRMHIPIPVMIKNVIGVHNGIIENFQQLKEKLTKVGYTFHSQTDTEVAVKLVDYYYKKYQEGPVDAMVRAMLRIRGSYALELMFQDYPARFLLPEKTVR